MNITEQQRKDYEDYQAHATRLSTIDEVAEFKKENDVFYPEGFGYRVCFKIEDEETYISVIQRCVMVRINEDWVPWFVDTWDGKSNNWIEFTSTVDGRDPEWILDGEDEVFAPSVEVCSYKFDINEYFEQPFEMYRTVIKVYAPGELRMPESLKQKLPFTLICTSIDTFDRMGSIKGNMLDVIEHSQLNQHGFFIM